MAIYNIDLISILFANCIDGSWTSPVGESMLHAVRQDLTLILRDFLILADN
jgi:hypothetical protein